MFILYYTSSRSSTLATVDNTSQHAANVSTVTKSNSPAKSPRHSASCMRALGLLSEALRLRQIWNNSKDFCIPLLWRITIGHRTLWNVFSHHALEGDEDQWSYRSSQIAIDSYCPERKQHTCSKTEERKEFLQCSLRKLPKAFKLMQRDHRWVRLVQPMHTPLSTGRQTAHKKEMPKCHTGGFLEPQCSLPALVCQEAPGPLMLRDPLRRPYLLSGQRMDPLLIARSRKTSVILMARPAHLPQTKTVDTIKERKAEDIPQAWSGQSYSKLSQKTKFVLVFLNKE